VSCVLGGVCGVVFVCSFCVRNGSSLAEKWTSVRPCFGVVFNAARLLVDDVNVGFVHGFSLWPHVLLRGYDAVGGLC